MFTASLGVLFLRPAWSPYLNPPLSWPLMNHQTRTSLLRMGNIYYFPGRTVPGCWTAIKQEHRDASFSSQPAYSSAFGTHRADALHPFGNCGMPWQTRAAVLFFGLNEPSDWWVRLSGYYKYSDKSSPPPRSELFNTSVPSRKWKGTKGKRHDHSEEEEKKTKNNEKQRWKCITTVEWRGEWLQGKRTAPR